jgi:hypothetical protein
MIAVAQKRKKEMEMENSVLALYIDLENLPGDLDIDALMQAISMEDPHGLNCIYALKAAYGSAEVVPKELKIKLRDNNFHIVDTPHIAKKKNRADLIISVDAFERLYLNNPSINRFIFVTSDSDFSVVMDKLRAYGKQVWLVCRKSDEARPILSKSCDNMLLIEDFSPSSISRNQLAENDEAARRLLVETLSYVDANQLPVKFSTVASKMKRIDPSFDIKTTSYKKFKALVSGLAKKGVVTVGIDEDGYPQIEDIEYGDMEKVCKGVRQKDRGTKDEG